MIDVQIENTLAKTVNDLLCDSSMKANLININNLTSYIQAAVLFDKVKLPARPGRDHPPTDLIPGPLRESGIFEVEVETDFAERMKRAQDKTLTLSDSFLTESLRRSVKRRAKNQGRKLVNFIDKELVVQGMGWKKMFWSDVEAIVNGKTGYEKEGVQKVLGHFESSEYTGLSQTEKVGIYYLWRCYYNIELAVDHQRVYLQNLVRSPLGKVVYELLRKDVIESPLLADCPIDLRSWVIENMSPGSPPQTWVRTLPTLLHTVLKTAHGERGKVADAILELRESKRAMAFRRYFRELRENTSTVGVMQKFDQDIEHLFDLWSNLSALGREPGTIATPFLKADIADMAKVLGNILRVPYLLARYRHLRIFWLKNPNSKKLNRELAGLIGKTFGEPVGW